MPNWCFHQLFVTGHATHLRGFERAVFAEGDDGFLRPIRGFAQDPLGSGFERPPADASPSEAAEVGLQPTGPIRRYEFTLRPGLLNAVALAAWRFSDLRFLEIVGFEMHPGVQRKSVYAGGELTYELTDTDWYVEGCVGGSEPPEGLSATQCAVYRAGFEQRPQAARPAGVGVAS